MSRFLNSWIQGIVIAVVIATILEMVLPNGNSKKYIKTVIGIYILFMIISPIINKITKGDSVNINKIIESANYKQAEIINNKLEIDSSALIEKAYISNMKEDIKSNIIKKGYLVNSLEIKIETEDEAKYGKINYIILNVKKGGIKENTISNNVKVIEKVNINISNNNTEINEEISEKEISKLEDYLEENYGTKKENIFINKII